MVGGGDMQPIVDVPALAEVRRRCYARPVWMRDAPLPVEPELYMQANAEMSAVMHARGWAVLAADIREPNFLLHGIPIVMDVVNG